MTDLIFTNSNDKNSPKDRMSRLLEQAAQNMNIDRELIAQGQHLMRGVPDRVSLKEVRQYLKEHLPKNEDEKNFIHQLKKNIKELTNVSKHEPDAAKKNTQKTKR